MKRIRGNEKLVLESTHHSNFLCLSLDIRKQCRFDIAHVDNARKQIMITLLMLWWIIFLFKLSACNLTFIAVSVQCIWLKISYFLWKNVEDLDLKTDSFGIFATISHTKCAMFVNIVIFFYTNYQNINVSRLKKIEDS